MTDAPDVPGRVSPIVDWLIGEARLLDDADALALGLVERLTDAGLPIARMMTAIPTLYADRRGLGRAWTPENGLRWIDFPWHNDAIYDASPFHRAHLTGEWVAFRLAEVSDSAFPIVAELRAGGFTHYVCIPIFFRDNRGGITFATRHPDGFRDADLAVLRAIEPAMAMLVDHRRTWRLLDETLAMYVGAAPHQHILSGSVQRGDVITMRAAILFADMKGFTALSSTLAAEGIVALLNRYFDCVVPPVEGRGGEVLKFIGDGVLAIHRADDDRAACAAALDAARDIEGRVYEIWSGREEPRFRVKIGLHLGEVAYGNIGSGARLDFTVVGQAVNVASRLTDLAGRLGETVLVSEAVARLLARERLVDRGTHALHGVPEAQRAFALGGRAGR